MPLLLTVINGKIDGFVGNNKIYIGRDNPQYKLKKSPLANPHHIGKDGNRHTVVEKFGIWLDAEIDKGIRGQYSAAFEELKRIRDQVLAGEKVELACYCKQPGRNVECHGDLVQDRVERMVRRRQQATEERSEARCSKSSTSRTSYESNSTRHITHSTGHHRAAGKLSACDECWPWQVHPGKMA